MFGRLASQPVIWDTTLAFHQSFHTVKLRFPWHWHLFGCSLHWPSNPTLASDPTEAASLSNSHLIGEFHMVCFFPYYPILSRDGTGLRLGRIQILNQPCETAGACNAGGSILERCCVDVQDAMRLGKKRHGCRVNSTGHISRQHETYI